MFAHKVDLSCMLENEVLFPWKEFSHKIFASLPFLLLRAVSNPAGNRTRGNASHCNRIAFFHFDLVYYIYIYG